MLFIDKLIKKILELKNPTVMGLDPDVEKFPEEIKNKFIKNGTLEEYGEAVKYFNKKLIDETYDIIPAIKPQLAYYEMYGIPGMEAFKFTVEYAREKGMLVIADGKRNDIGTTAKAYSKAYLAKNAFDVDALTVNGYLGSDGINSFLEECTEYDKGIFILVKTSNPSSGELQDLSLGEEKIYEKMGSMVENWGKDLIGEYGYSSVGAVVGATYPKQLKELREKMPHTFFLVPGYGAQGGKAEDIRLAVDKNNLGVLVNSSRGLMYAKSTREEALRMKKDLWREE